MLEKPSSCSPIHQLFKSLWFDLPQKNERDVIRRCNNQGNSECHHDTVSGHPLYGSLPDRDTVFFDNSAGVLQGDTLAPYIFIICLDYVLRKALDKNNELGFALTKRKSKRYPAMKITDADYADDLAVLADVLKNTTFLLHSKMRQQVEDFKYLGSYMASTEHISTG